MNISTRQPYLQQIRFKSLAIIPVISMVVLAAVYLWPRQHSVANEQLRQAAEQRSINATDQLIWDYQERVRLNPEQLQSRAILGSAYIQKARETGDPSWYAKAETVIDGGLALQPDHFEALIVKGNIALARHQFREALALGQQAQAAAPLVPRVYGVIADAQIELGMYPQAVESVQQMVDMRPDLSSYARVAYIRELYGDLDGAIDAMSRAVRAGGPTTENVEWTRVQLGNLYIAKGDLAGAEQHYLLSLATDPEYPYALAGLARVRAGQGHLTQAIDLYQQAIARAPLPEFVIGLGELYQSVGQDAEAAEQYALVRAMQQLFAANGVATDLELALFEADHGNDPQTALRLAEQAYAQRPSIKAADTLAWALYQNGRYDEARQYAEQALRLGTQDALMFYHIGMIAHAQGDTDTARRYLEQAVALNPYFSSIYAPQAYATLASLAATP
jgi:tetratricopeptide (TPR) repeat protein